jgi:valyl-tRNA synthetase
MSKEYKNYGFVVAETEAEAREKVITKFPELKDKKFSLRQDEDCLDTWFSSWLWPISVFDGINNPDNEDINYYYPTNDLVTAPEIIFFWVARMIISGFEYRQQPCFKNVYFTGIVRDKIGRKMSKSLGNSPDPIALMEKYGADGVRMGMLLSSPAGNDLPFDEALCEQGRNFNNKIWNAFRMTQGLETVDTEQPEGNRIAVEWFYSRLFKTVNTMDDLFSKYRISEALMEVYKLFWDEFSAWYLEAIKPEYGKPLDKKTYDSTIYFFDMLLRLLHPFMPFITEELWQSIEQRAEGESIMTAAIPEPTDFICEPMLNGFETAKQIIAGIRTVRQQKNISPKEQMTLQVSAGQEHDATFNLIVSKLANVAIETVDEKSSGAASFMVGTCEYAVPIGDLINVEEELKKLTAELKYQEGFLESVMKKLDNERFVANAKPEIVENERNKKAQAEEKIILLKASIESITKINEH